MAEGGSSLIGAAEYEAIEAAVMETARGRWFLAEFARRNRTADTTVLLDAIGRLEKAVAGERRAQGVERIRFDLSEMAKAIGRMKTEVASLRPDDQQGPLVAASEALDGIVRTTERATSDILEAAERMQEAAWTLREGGADSEFCDALDRHATEIYTACSFQDLTAQRTAKVVDALRYLEGRIEAMIDVWGGADPAAAEAEPPPVVRLVEGADLSQSEIDDVIVEAGILELDPVTSASVEATAPAAEDPAPSAAMAERTEEALDQEPARPAETVDAVANVDARAPRGVDVDALAAIDALPTREKLRRFT